jgi:hypothetical protein
MVAFAAFAAGRVRHRPDRLWHDIKIAEHVCERRLGEGPRLPIVVQQASSGRFETFRVVHILT